MAAPVQFNSQISEALAEWELATTAYNRAKAQLDEAAKSLDQAGKILGGLLVPVDAKEGEIFNLWVGNTLVQCWATDGPYGHEYHSKNRS